MEFNIIRLSNKNVDRQQFDRIIYKVAAVDVLDMDSGDDLSVFLHTIIKGGAHKIIVNMKDLEFIDSAGIGILINAAKLIRNNKGDMVLINVSERVKNIFKPINLERFLKTFEMESQAIDYFRLVY